MVVPSGDTSNHDSLSDKRKDKETSENLRTTENLIKDNTSKDASKAFQAEQERKSKVSADLPSVSIKDGNGCLKDLQNSSKPEDQAAASTLDQMLKNLQKRDTALLLLEIGERSIDRQAMHQMLGLMKDPKQEKNVQDIFGLVKSNKESDGTAALSLTSMLASKDPSVQTDAEKLMSLMRNNEQKPVASSVLAMFSGLNPVSEHKQVHEMLKMLDDPSLKTASSELLKLLGNENTALSAKSVLGCLGAPPGEDQTDGIHLMQLLNSANPRDRQNACGLLRLSQTADFNQLKEALQLDSSFKAKAGRVIESLTALNNKQHLLSDLDLKKGSAALSKLANTEDEGSAKVILKLLSGSHGKDRAEGFRLLLDRNGNDYQSALTLSKLCQTYNIDQLEKTLPDLTIAAKGEKVIDLLTASDGKQRMVAEPLLDLLISYNPSDKKKANDLINLYSGDKAQQDAADTILTMKNGRLQQQMIDLLSSKHDPNATEQLLTWLRGNPKDQSATLGLLKLIGNDKANKGEDNASKNVNPSDQLLKMIVDKEQQETAYNLLTKLDSSLDIQAMLGYMNAPNHPCAKEQLVNMLNSEDGRETDILRNLLSMSTSSQPENYRDAQKLFKMLDEPAKQDTTKWILSELSSDDENNRDKERHRMLALLANPQNADIAAKLRVMLASENATSVVAQSILADFDDPVKMRKILTLLDDKENKHAVSELREMLTAPITIEGPDGSLLKKDSMNGAVQLVNMFCDPKPEIVGIGEHFWKMLNEPDKHYAKRILSTQENLTEMSARKKEVLDTLLNLDKTSASLLIEDIIFQQRNFSDRVPAKEVGLRHLVALLGSEDDKTRRDGQLLVDWFKNNDPNRQKIAEALISNRAKFSSPIVLQKISQALGSNEARHSAEKVAELLAASNSEAVHAAGICLAEIMSEKKVGKGKEELLKMLDQSEQRDTALKVVGTLKDPALVSKFLELTSSVVNQHPEQREFSKQLIQMLNSSNTLEQQKALSNLMQVMEIVEYPDKTNDAANSIISEMINPEKHKDVKTILANLRDPNSCVALFEVFKNEKFALGGQVLVDLLRSTNRLDNESAEHLLQLLKSPTGSSLRKNADKILSMLSHSESQNLARQALVNLDEYNVGGRGGLFLATLLEKPECHAYLRKFSEMKQDDNRQGMANLIAAESKQNTDRFCRLVTYFNDPQNEQAKPMMSLLQQRNTAEIARVVLDLAMSLDEKQKNNGKQMLDILTADPFADGYRSTSSRLLTTLSVHALSMLAILNDKNMQTAVEELSSMVESGNAGNAAKLMRMLEKKRPEGQRILSILNKGNKYEAIRLLETVRNI